MDYHIDYETFSRADITKLGAFRYASDPSTQILLCAVARGDGKPLLWDFSRSKEENAAALCLIKEAAKSGNRIYAHNSQFEYAVSKHLWRDTFGFDPPKLEQWRCTAAMCRRAAIPSSLDGASRFLATTNQKKKDGIALIKLFSCPRTAGELKGERIFPTAEGTVTVAGVKMKTVEAWELFRGYCLVDVLTEQEIHRALHAFELEGQTLSNFLFDARMNDRGLPVNLDALEKARVITDDSSRMEIERFFKLTSLVPSQTGKVLEWLRGRGYPGDDLQEATMEKWIEKESPMTAEVLEALQIRARLSFAAVKKIPAMVKIADTDGRVRGTFMWSGAIRTHRWSGKLVQPQNFKKPTIKDTRGVYQAVKDGWDAEMIDMVWGNPTEAVASCIRHFIEETDCNLLDADYSNIEARITPWVAGQEDLLQAFRDGRDCYVEMAAVIFSKPADEITKAERFVGKTAILGAGFQIGWEKYQSMCSQFGVKLSDDICKQTIKIYRETNDQITTMWRAMQRGAVNAISNPGESFTVRDKVTFVMAEDTPFPALYMVLPSGHRLVYPVPAVRRVWMFRKNRYDTQAEAEKDYVWMKKLGKLKEEDRVWETDEISFYGPNHVTNQWERTLTYGGKLLENLVQSLAGDFMSHGAVCAEKAGYDIIALIHDQALAQFRPENGNSVEGFRAALCTLPAWAKGFPLEATCDITPYYTKD